MDRAQSDHRENASFWCGAATVLEVGRSYGAKILAKDDPVHFGIIMVVNMEVRMCHPPVGLNLYVASGITKMGITELTIAVWPWLLTMLVFLVVVTYRPTLSIFLPQVPGMMR